MINSIYFENNELKLKSSAATPILYREMFKKDLIKTVMAFQTIKDSLPAEGEEQKDDEKVKAFLETNGLEFLDFLKELAFIMNLEATVPATDIFSKLNFTQYVVFLSSYDEQIFYKNSSEIMSVYNASTKTASKSKNA